MTTLWISIAAVALASAIIKAAAQEADEVDQRITFQRKRREAKKAKDGHFAQLQFIEERHGINPLRARGDIPGLPKPAANQS